MKKTYYEIKVNRTKDGKRYTLFVDDRDFGKKMPIAENRTLKELRDLLYPILQAYIERDFLTTGEVFTMYFDLYVCQMFLKNPWQYLYAKRANTHVDGV